MTNAASFHMTVNGLYESGYSESYIAHVIQKWYAKRDVPSMARGVAGWIEFLQEGRSVTVSSGICTEAGAV